MAVIIEMPKLSDTMDEGSIASWLKAEGEEVEDGEPLLEVETDKATMEYASPEEGFLLKILVKENQAVPLGTAIAVMGEKGEKYDLDALLAGRHQAAAPEKQAASEPTKAAKAPTKQVEAPQKATTGRVKASPLAKKMAKDKGVDISQISGSGPNGRVVAKDLEGASSSATTTSFSPCSGAAETVVPLTMMRKTIAKRLLAGKNEAPHFYLTVSANMDAVFEWRAEINSDPGVKDGSIPKVSVNDIITMATSRALLKHPDVNASWQGDSIVQYGDAHICMAVALPTGLMTPVIRYANQMGLRDIAAEAKRLGKKAKNGELTNEDFQGGTFTISNLGMTIIDEFTAIINPPQAAILAVGRSVDTPWVENGEITIQKRMKMTLSSDHRVVDGMVGAQFLQTLVSYLENPAMMLI